MEETQETVKYRDIPGFPGYRVGDDGSVWSCRNCHHPLLPSWHSIKPRPVKNGGHKQVCMWKDGKRHYRYVHRLVLEAFVGPCPSGMEARHFPDRDTANNKLCNLAWGTKEENRADMVYHGTKHPLAKIAEQDVREIRRKAAAGVSQTRIARHRGIGQTTVSAIVRRKIWAFTV